MAGYFKNAADDGQSYMNTLGGAEKPDSINLGGLDAAMDCLTAHAEARKAEAEALLRGENPPEMQTPEACKPFESAPKPPGM